MASMNVSGCITSDKIIRGEINQNTIVKGGLSQNNTVLRSKINQKTFLNGRINDDTLLKGEIENAANFSKRELYFSSRFEFPNIGDTDRLYIAEDERAVYLFSAENLCYICIGRDYNEIDTIICDI